jgi:similar to stage IV sporulation protein
VEVVEKTISKEVDKTPANIIASKDGVITEVIALTGQSVVKKGDTVKKGDILIKGLTYDGKETSEAVPQLAPEPIRANGIVKAKVWYEGYGETELVTASHERTGQKKVSILLRIFGHEFYLKPVTLDSEKQFDVEVVNKKLSWWRNSDVAVEYIISTYYELTTKMVELNIEEAREQGKIKALEEIQDLIPATAHVLSRTVEVLKTSETNLVRVKVNIETAEDIGQVMNIP